MGLLGKMVQGAIDTVLLPVDVVKDVVTLGNATDGGDPHTIKKLKKLKKKAKEVYEDLDR